MPPSAGRKYRRFGAALLAALLADQLTKAWARGALRGRGPLVVIPHYFDLQYAENPGIAFSLLRDHAYTRFLVPLIGIAALVVIAALVRRARPERTLLALGLGLLAGGALGNVIDRVALQRVTDFVVWKAPMDSWLCQGIARVMALFGSRLLACQWATFNVADAALLLGAAALLLEARADATAEAPTPGSRP